MFYNIPPYVERFADLVVSVSIELEDFDMDMRFICTQCRGVYFVTKVEIEDSKVVKLTLMPLLLYIANYYPCDVNRVGPGEIMPAVDGFNGPVLIP